MVKTKAKSKNKPTGKNSENSNLKIIAWVITALIAICGGVPGVIQIIDYFSIPQINVISITPVLVYDEVTYNNPWNATFTYDDFYFVIEVSALKNPVYISKLKLSGRLALSPIDCLTDGNKFIEGADYNPTVFDSTLNCETDLYYDTILYAQTLDEMPIKLDSYENKNIEFKLLEGFPRGQRECGWVLPRSNYIGSKDKVIEPKYKNTCPQLSFLLKTKNGGFSENLRDEYLSGEMKLFLIIGSKEVEVAPDTFKPLAYFQKSVWEKYPHQKLLSRST